MSDLYLFDTNILVHLVRNDSTGQELKSKYSPFLSDPKPFICSVTDGELRSLALQWAWGKHKTDQMGYMLGYFRQVPIERPDLMQTYAAMDFFSNSKGIKMGKNDLWIAAAAYTSGAKLVTTDDDFDHLAPNFISVDKIELQ
jgi:predicted nucleic acid-binding protein